MCGDSTHQESAFLAVLSAALQCEVTVLGCYGDTVSSLPLETDSQTTAAQLPPQTSHVSLPQIEQVICHWNQDN